MSGFSSQRIDSSKKRTKSKAHLSKTVRDTAQLSRDRPALIRRWGLAVLSLVLLVFLLWQVTQIVEPAEIEVVSPTVNLITTERELELGGNIEPGSILTVNGEQFVVDELGVFSQSVYLQPGLNSFTFEVRKRYSKAKQVIRHVYLETE